MTAIAFCYAITPILQWLSRYGSAFLIWGVVIFAAIVLLRFPQYGFRASWLVLYALGYFLASTKRYEKFALGVLSTVCLIIQLSFSFSWQEMMYSKGAWCVTFHLAGAVIIFLTGLLIVSLLKKPSVPEGVRCIDQYSFQIYIVHHILIMPPFGLLYVTDYIVLNICVILMYIVFFTWVLNTMEIKVDNILSKLIRKDKVI